MAIDLIKRRLADEFKLKPRADYAVVGEPVSLPDARQLAADNKLEFQSWALGMVGARRAIKKGGDRGIDGKLFFHDDPKKPAKTVILSVKGGENIGPKDIRELSGAVEQEKAQLGALITLAPPTEGMRRDAASGGFYESPWDKKEYPRLQILTVEQLFDGAQINMPRTGPGEIQTFKKAPKPKRRSATQKSLDLKPEPEAED